MMDNLLAFFPPTIINQRTGDVAWFTLGAGDGFWQAGYLNEDGEPVGSFYATGVSPQQAVQKLVEHFQLIDMLNRPAIKVNELTGEIEGEAS